MATHSSILAWKISWTEESGGLQSMGLQRVGHNCVADTFTFHSVLPNPHGTEDAGGWVLGEGGPETGFTGSQESSYEEHLWKMQGKAEGRAATRRPTPALTTSTGARSWDGHPALVQTGPCQSLAG